MSLLTSCASGLPTLRCCRRVIAGLRIGDEVVTTAGFIATVADIREPDDGEVELLLDLGGVRVRARTNAVADRLPRPNEGDEVEPPIHQEREETNENVDVAAAVT